MDLLQAIATRGNERVATLGPMLGTLGTMLGVVVMLVLDVALGEGARDRDPIRAFDI